MEKFTNQQGDVLLFAIHQLPENIKPVKPVNGRLILAEGEATGHAHAIAGGPNVGLFERDGTLYLSVKKDAELVHEEHHAHTIKPGAYRIGKVVEMDPFEDEIREVAD